MSAVIETFFDRFVKEFATFDATRVATLFATPGVALRRDGAIVALTKPEDVERYYQSALDHYRKDGCVSCGWTELEVVAMGDASALASVTWRLLRADESLVASWRQSYCLRMIGAEVAIFASAMHAR
jgi:hypothetical protein